jgi:hypothetical protein
MDDSLLLPNGDHLVVMIGVFEVSLSIFPDNCTLPMLPGETTNLKGNPPDWAFRGCF